MKIPNKTDLHQVTFNQPSDIGCKDNMKTYKQCCRE